MVWDELRQTAAHPEKGKKVQESQEIVLRDKTENSDEFHRGFILSRNRIRFCFALLRIIPDGNEHRFSAWTTGLDNIQNLYSSAVCQSVVAFEL